MINRNEHPFGAASIMMREERNNKLFASDWTQIPDCTLPNKALWATYRQALRDLTNQEGFPYIEFPTPPSTTA